MSLLPYVIAFLTILAGLTYVRMESTKTTIPIHMAYRDYARESQRWVQEEAWNQKYEDTVLSEGGKKDQQNQPIDGTGRINLLPLVNSDQYPQEMQAVYRTALITLITDLYRKEPFFDEFLKENPSWVEGVVDALANKEIKRFEDLNELVIEDDLLNRALFHLLKGEEGLRHYTTFSTKTKLSVYLAPEPVLMAVYRDLEFVGEVVAAREEAYKQLRRSGSDREALAGAFAMQVSGLPSSMKEYFTFGISLTQPPKS